ncbi:hypothetical protein [Endozoicomonas euniceicola]|uniref:Uncharacterized protein n=1 Tax=Endozoicomonas euniceicola TaxID=1234143 RepID=A0ABY6GNS7_9GAMM|nr:hypothetical protein [Endozoicomonas euniceicola]UYM14049.1 hypothetical protein NX720_14130 [Endozoicomonas euniceicola]
MDKATLEAIAEYAQKMAPKTIEKGYLRIEHGIAVFGVKPLKVYGSFMKELNNFVGIGLDVNPFDSYAACAAYLAWLEAAAGNEALGKLIEQEIDPYLDEAGVAHH